MRRAPQRARNAAPEAADTGPRERWQHHELSVVEVAALGRRFRNATATPLDAYRHRGYISERQFDGGDRFRRIHGLAALLPRLTRDPSRPLGMNHGAGDLADAQLEARAAYRASVAAIGRVSAKLAHNVCCFDVAIGDIEAELEWRKGYGMIRLREALDALADYFHLP